MQAGAERIQYRGPLERLGRAPDGLRADETDGRDKVEAIADK